MANLYHFVPKNMRGSTLYPLNKLKDVYPKAYEEERKKYEGREQVLEREIPYLDCLWNDVLHFTAVHPQDIKDALNTDKPMKVFVVDTHDLEPDKTIVYLYNHEDRNEKMGKDNFAQYDPNKIEQYASLPQETKKYYKEKLEQGDRPLLFVKVPHILYQGSIDISDLEVVKV